MYQEILKPFLRDPTPYESNGIPFGDDPHIASSMLEAHLSPDSDGASRTHAFIRQSVDWIASLVSPEGKTLLDLGCGPGIYAECLHNKGFRVTGIDFSRNSIGFAKRSSNSKGLDIAYHYQDYLTIDYENVFDIAALIYCDFGVLPPEDRGLLLKRVCTAIKPGGLFIVDAFTPNNYTAFGDKLETTFEEGGFWRAGPYLNLKRSKMYPGAVYLEQYIIITEDNCLTYNLWNHAFRMDELAAELKQAGFESVDFYGDVAGAAYSHDSGTICAVGRKS